MSTISITPAQALPALRPSTRLRLTVRGRRVLAALVALPVALGIVLAAWGGVSAIASADEAPAVSFETITVLPGDTLWSLAGEIAPATDPREVIDAIMRLNMLDGGQVFVGQELAIPLSYTQG